MAGPTKDIKEIKADISQIKVTMAINTTHLAEHMKRTDLLEKRFDSFWSKCLTVVSIIGGVTTIVKVLLS